MSDLINRAESIKAINKRLDKIPVDRPDVAFGLCVAAGVLHDMPSASQDNVKTLEAIRAEIEALPKTYPFINHIDTYVKEDDVKKIIDKYRIAERREE